jgi:hypothetical protein
MTYETSFPLTENPISEGSLWINGGVVGLKWYNVVTLGGYATGEDSPEDYADPTAIIKGTWGPNQTVEVTVKNNYAEAGGTPEVEIRLRSTIEANVNKGYEVLFSCLSTAISYCQIMRWDGDLGDFHWLDGHNGAAYGVTDGDVIRATIVGSKIDVYKNGSPIMTADDATFSDGNPGIGFYGKDIPWEDIGLTHFWATDGIDTRYVMLRK